MHTLAVPVLAATLLLTPRSGVATDAPDSKLDPRIGDPDRGKFISLCDARDWRNPLLGVTDGGFRLRTLSSSAPRFVASADLRRALAELPVTDWPYGRIVAIPHRSQVERHAESLAAMTGVLDVLHSLRAGWWTWPRHCGGAGDVQRR